MAIPNWVGWVTAVGSLQTIYFSWSLRLSVNKHDSPNVFEKKMNKMSNFKSLYLTLKVILKSFSGDFTFHFYRL